MTKVSDALVGVFAVLALLSLIVGVLAGVRAPEAAPTAFLSGVFSTILFIALAVFLREVITIREAALEVADYFRQLRARQPQR